MSSGEPAAQRRRVHNRTLTADALPHLREHVAVKQECPSSEQCFSALPRMGPPSKVGSWWCVDCDAPAGQYCQEHHALMMPQSALRRKLQISIEWIGDQMKAAARDINEHVPEEHAVAALKILTAYAPATCDVMVSQCDGVLRGKWRLPGAGVREEGGDAIQRIMLALQAARGSIASMQEEAKSSIGERLEEPLWGGTSTGSSVSLPSVSKGVLSAEPGTASLSVSINESEDEAGSLSTVRASPLPPPVRKIPYLLRSMTQAASPNARKEPPGLSQKRRSWKTKKVRKQKTLKKFRGRCIICGMACSSWEENVLHQKVTHNLKLPTCHLCLAVFASKAALRQHKEKHENILNRFKCTQCNAVFTSVGRLHRHERRFHR